MEDRDRNCSGRSMAGLLAGCVVGRAVGWLAIRTLQQRCSEVLCAYGYVAVGKARQAEQAVNESRRLERGSPQKIGALHTQLNSTQQTPQPQFPARVEGKSPAESVNKRRPVRYLHFGNTRCH
jgi:hypothetical protein